MVQVVKIPGHAPGQGGIVSQREMSTPGIEILNRFFQVETSLCGRFFGLFLKPV
jgi:hypothetical protein